MMRKAGIWVLFCAAIGSSGGMLATSAGAEGVPQLPPLPAAGPEVVPAEIQGAVEGTVEGTVGAVTEAAKTATGEATPPPAPPAEASGSDGGEGGKLAAGATKVAAGEVEAAQGVAERVAGATSQGSTNPSAGSGNPPAAASPPPEVAAGALTPVEEAGPTTSAADSTASDRRTSRHLQAAADPNRRSTAPAPGIDPAVAEVRRIAGAVDPASSVRAAFAATIGKVAAGTDGALADLTPPSASDGASATAASKDAGDDRGSLRIPDLGPGGALGTVLFLLFLGAMAVALYVVTRRELGIGPLPRRRYRG